MKDLELEKRTMMRALAELRSYYYDCYVNYLLKKKLRMSDLSFYEFLLNEGPK